MLGIHLSSKILKIVELEDNPKDNGLKVLDWSINYFSSEKLDDSHVKAITAAVKNKNFSSRQAVVALSGTELEYKLVELPMLPDKEVGPALKLKLGSIFSFPIEKAAVDYIKISNPQTAGKQWYLAAALPKDYIMNIVKTVTKAGLKVIDVMASSSSLFNATTVAYKEPFVSVYINKYLTLIVLVKNNQVVFAREVLAGGENITQAMVGSVQTEAGKIDFDYAKAEEVKIKYGIPVDFEAYTKEANLPAAEIFGLMRPALEKIGEEVLRTLAYYRETTADQAEFSKAYFSGGASKTKNIIAYFSSTLGINIEPLPVVAVSDKKEFPEAVPLLGLAIGAASRKKPSLSLLPQELRGSPWSSLINLVNVWTIAAAYLLLLMLIFGYYSFKQAGLQSRLKDLQGQVQKLEEIKKTSAASQTPALANLVKGLGVKSKTDRFIKIIGYIHRSTPKGIYFQKLSYDRKTGQFVISGVMLKERGKSALANFIDSLKKDGYFKTLDIAYFRESGVFTEPTFEFELRCQLSGEK